jgi:two-component system response regulator YesN
LIKVVVVEDEYFVRRGIIMTTPWAKFGCEVIGEAEDGVNGEMLIEKLHPDLVLADIRMPGIDGLDMIRHLKEKKVADDIEFIIISGYDEFNYAQRALKLGVKDYILKPVDITELNNTLDNISGVINSRKLKKKLEEKIDKLVDSNLANFKEYISSSGTDLKENYIERIIQYIKENYMYDINIQDAAEKLFISPSYICKLIKSKTSYTFMEYLTSFRIKKAMELLKDPEAKIYAVANSVGYKDSRYFSQVFKKHVGMTPQEYRQK